MSAPKVTVIMPVYNAEKYLQRSLGSLVGQTLQDIEIICVNDGSTDCSLRLLRQWSEKDERIVVVDQLNSGAGAARNAGLCIATGEYLSFLDADDLFEPNMLLEAYNAAKTYEADIVVFGADFYYEDIDKFRKEPWLDLGRLPSGNPFSIFDIDGNPFRATNGWTWDKLFRRSFILDEQIEFQEQRTYNDMDFTFISFIRAKRIVKLDQTLIHQRKNHGCSLSQTCDQSWWCVYEALIGLKRELCENKRPKTLMDAFENYALHMLHFNTRSVGRAPVFPELYNAMRERWLKDLGIEDRPADYFDIADDAQWYKRVCSQELEEYLMSELVESDKRVAQLKNENSNLKAKLVAVESKLQGLLKSKRYRLGSAIAAIPHRFMIESHR